MSSTPKDITRLLLCSTLYRLASGALMVSLTWNIVSQAGENYVPLAIAILCSFLPAFLAPALIRRLASRFDGARLSMLFIASLSAVALVAGLAHDQTAVLLVMNLSGWLLVLLLEASLDMWFARVQSGLDENRAQRISGATTAGGQAALMAGPLLAAALTPLLGTAGLGFVLAGIFLGVAAACRGAATSERPPARTARPAQALALPLPLFIAMMLVWPTLGAFNFMLPVYVASHGWALFELGVLDAAFGLGMAVIGALIVATPSQSRPLPLLAGLLACSIAAVAAWWLCANTLLGKGLSLLVLGIAFGGARVYIRTAVARRLPESAVGEAVSRANALATPVLLVMLLCQLGYVANAWLAPFLMVMVSSGLLLRVAGAGHRPSVESDAQKAVSEPT